MKRHNFVIVIIFLLLAFGCIVKAEEKVPMPAVPVPEVENKGYSCITVSELKQKIEQNKRFVLLDVRTRDEYARGYIEGAVLIPADEIEAGYKELKLGCKCREIVVYCQGGHCAEPVVKFLIGLGFRRTKKLIGGIEAWKESGGKVVNGE